jgi:hypothetical protein
MIRVVRHDGSVLDVAKAEYAERLGREIVLTSRVGRIVARFECSSLLAYGPPEMLPGDPMTLDTPELIEELQPDCAHSWVRLRRLEESLDVVVHVRECVNCGRLEAKPGHKDPLQEDSWVAINGN